MFQKIEKFTQTKILLPKILRNLKTKFRYKFGGSLRLAITLLNKIKITRYFENLIVELHVLYTLNIHVKFCVNRILFTL